MPKLSHFYGIIGMYYDDHPPPHFYVQYGENKAKIQIDTHADAFDGCGSLTQL